MELGFADGQQDLEGRPLAGLAGDLDLAAVFGDGVSCLARDSHLVAHGPSASVQPVVLDASGSAETTYHLPDAEDT